MVRRKRGNSRTGRKIPVMDAYDQGHLNPVYHTQSSPSSSNDAYFAGQPIRDGFTNGNFGEDYLRPEVVRGRLEVTEEIQRELEKEKIRAEIIAEEIERRRILREEVLNEMMIERQMAMRSAGGFPSPFWPIHDTLFEPGILHRQPIGFEERIAASLEGNPNDGSLSGAKRNSTPSVAGTSSEPRAVDSKKKVTEEWSCAICRVSATSEHGLKDHIQGKKHQEKEKALLAQKTGANFGLGVPLKKPTVTPIKPASTTTQPSSCDKKKSKTIKKSVDPAGETSAICRVSATSEHGIKDHIQGKKHQKKEKALLAQKTGANFGLGVPLKKPTVTPIKPASTTTQPSSCDKKKSKTIKKSVDPAGETSAICRVSATSEHGLKDHIQGKKHQKKEKALLAQKTGANFGLGVPLKKPTVKPIKPASTTTQPSSCDKKKSTTIKKSVDPAGETSTTSNASDPNVTENKKDKFKYWCEICGIGVQSEEVMNNHKKGKKHKLHQKGKLEAEKPKTETKNVTEEKTDTETKKAVIVETVKGVDFVKQDVTGEEIVWLRKMKVEMKTVKNDTEDVTAVEDASDLVQ